MSERHLIAGEEVVVATHNPGKIREFAELFQPYGLSVLSAAEMGLEEPEETEASFAGNARIKAESAALSSLRPAIADDSGLQVEVLDGAPGVYSARWAGPEKDFEAAMQRLHDDVAAVGGWQDGGPRAAFVCVLCVVWPDLHHRFFTGRVDGHLVWPARGSAGFGYDPIFVPDGDDRTFGEMASTDKQAVSHRARAFAKFVEGCLDGSKS